jgi:malonyl-CoA O-methyltransferase|uniref:Malonyl-[acyl-carrier protein] O-methyltransferase n=1 Tax=Desulfobacca acetoxidans TaxID=60893 RepID=A0A7C3WIT7_9BACT
MPHKHAIRRNFARRAATYDAHAQVQRFMAEELLRQTGARVSRCRSILEVGCGTGYLTQKLRRWNPSAWLVAVDLDVVLLQRARARLNGDPATGWLVADGETLVRGSFDLIISNSTFQWFSEPQETLKRYRNCLAPGGFLAFSAMGPDTFRELALSLREAARKLNCQRPPEIAAEKFLKESDWLNLLAAAGFREIHLKKEGWRVNFPSVREFLASLRATGATNPEVRPLSPRLFQALLATYQERYAINGSIPVSYELIWALARN